jgi:hypothetical protein
MQTIEDVVWSGVQDAKDYLNSASKTFKHDTHLVKQGWSRGERDIRRGAQRFKNSARKDLHMARRTVSHGVHDVETSFRHVKHGLHKDWNKLDTFTRKEYNKVTSAIDNGINNVEGKVAGVKNWFSGSINTVESDVLQIAFLGAVLVYAFRNQIGTGAKYLLNEASSTGKKFIDEGIKVAPYAPLLLL